MDEDLHFLHTRAVYYVCCSFAVGAISTAVWVVCLTAHYHSVFIIVVEVYKSLVAVSKVYRGLFEGFMSTLACRLGEKL